MGRLALIVILVSTAAISGCTWTSGPGGPLTGLSKASAEVRTCIGAKPGDNSSPGNDQSLIPALMNSLATDPSAPASGAPEDAFDALLDCYVGPVDATNLEERLVRGHVIVTMLAMYGKYNLGVRRYNGVENDAATILKSISAADLSLSRSSNLLYRAAGYTTDLTKTPLQSYYRVDRVVDVLQVAIDVERPTIARAKEDVLNIVAAIGGSPTAVRDLVDGALAVIKKVTVLEVYGPAVRRDAYNFLQGMKGRGHADLTDWTQWDTSLYEACKPIAELARGQNQCVPSAATLKASFASDQVPKRQ